MEMCFVPSPPHWNHQTRFIFVLSWGEMQRDSADSTALHFRVTWCLIGTKDGSVSSSSGVHFTLPNPLLHEERGCIVPSMKVTQRVTSERAAVSSAAFPAEVGAP